MIQLPIRYNFSFIFSQSPAVDVTGINGDLSMMSGTY